MTTFGQQVRAYRKQCRDSLRGGALTQVRLGELLGDESGNTDLWLMLLLGLSMGLVTAVLDSVYYFNPGSRDVVWGNDYHASLNACW
ncbi:MAG: hypothetical protein KC441_18365 [Anaerolineales bacterium]|nr:hypothetical protein [Anaerolineales bacterium]